jgi:hypothetical protein
VSERFRKAGKEVTVALDDDDGRVSICMASEEGTVGGVLY